MAATKRKPISKKLRFEVFKRDSFKCQYCGKCAPDVILEVDHIDPVSKGGDNDLMNLITACNACNAGKSDRLLSDDSVVAKQRQQLAELNERREQLEMMLQWRDGLKKIDEDTVERVAATWQKVVKGWHLNESGLKTVRTLLRKASLIHILDAIDIVSDKYLERDESGEFTAESVNLAWSKVAAIAKAAMLPDYERQLLYIRGICRNRFTYCDDATCIHVLKQAYEAGIDLDTLTAIAKEERNWTNWQKAMYAAMNEE